MSTPAPDKSHPRTEAALARLQQAMRDIEAEIQENHGIYPFNYGRVTQSELCRRADVKKATLQNPGHKDTTRVEIMRWLDELNAGLSQTRESTRERVTAVADHLSGDVARLTQANQALLVQLEQAQHRLAQLEQENAGLRQRLGAA
jgi:chromosome segregation ATPase